MNAVAERIAAIARVVPLSEAVELNPRPDRGSLPDELDVSFVPMAAVEAATGRMDATAIRRFGDVKKGYTVFREEDVLFAKITPCMENGKMAVARGLHNGVGCGSTEFHVLRPRPGIDPHYVYHFVSSARFRAEAAHHMTGAVGQKRVPARFLEQCEIPLPELEEQRRIVSEIEKQLSRLDAGVANLKRVKANLKRYKAAVLKAAVEGCLVPTEAELARSQRRGYETGGQLRERIMASVPRSMRAAKSAQRPSEGGGGMLVALPRGWSYARIGELAELVEYGSSAKASESGVGVPVLRMGNIVDGDLDLSTLKYLPDSHEEFPRLLLRPGDLLFNRTNSPELVGKTAVFKGRPEKCSFASYLIRVRLASGCMSEFVSTFINSVYGRKWIKTVATQQVGQANVNGTKLQNLLIPLPPIVEQERIVSEIGRRLSVFGHVEASIDANWQQATLLREAALHFQYGRL